MVLIQERVPPLRISRAPFAATLGTYLPPPTPLLHLAALWGVLTRGLAVVPPEGEVGALLPCQLEVQNLTGIPQFVTLAIQDLQGTPHQSISLSSFSPFSSHHTGAADASAEPYYFHAGEMETGFMIQPRSSQVFGPPTPQSSRVGFLTC